MKKLLLICVCYVVASATFAEGPSFDHYQTIVNRQMFGALPPGFDSTKLPSEVSKADQKQLSKDQEKLKSAIHFSVINVTPDGATAVGFSDNSNPKAPVHYYLKVGESRNGWVVKEADAAAATMTIAKDDIEVSLSLGGNSAKDADATMKAGSSILSRPAESKTSPNFISDLKSRRMEKKRKALKEEESKRMADEIEAQRRKVQEEASARQGAMLQTLLEKVGEIQSQRATSEAKTDESANADAENRENASAENEGSND